VRHPPEILHAVVETVAVPMVYLREIVRIGNKQLGDETVDKAMPLITVCGTAT